MYITKEINLDVSRGYHGELITMKQFDQNSRFLRIRLTNNNEPLAISSNEYAILKAKRIDNSYRSFNCTINDDGTITAKIPSWALKRS